VVLFISSHGYADPEGIFYVVRMCSSSVRNNRPDFAVASAQDAAR
jgi:hypothetical protein